MPCHDEGFSCWDFGAFEPRDGHGMGAPIFMAGIESLNSLILQIGKRRREGKKKRVEEACESGKALTKSDVA